VLFHLLGLLLSSNCVWQPTQSECRQRVQCQDRTRFGLTTPGQEFFETRRGEAAAGTTIIETSWPGQKKSSQNSRTSSNPTPSSPSSARACPPPLLPLDAHGYPDIAAFLT
jgi:hypothetical protein